MPVGERLGEFSLAIKTAKKKWQVNGKWIQQVLLMDKTGDILADVNIVKYIPLIAGQEIRIIVAEVQSTEIRNVPALKLYIDQFEIPATIGEPDNIPDLSGLDSSNVIRGKIKCWLVAAKVETGVPEKEILKFAQSDALKAIIDSIMEG